MQESFDNKLSNKFRNVFEHYREPFDPKAWEKMKKKLSRKKKRSIIWLNIIAKAASVILIAGLSIIFGGKFIKNNLFSEKKDAVKAICLKTENHINNSRKIHSNIIPETIKTTTNQRRNIISESSDNNNNDIFSNKNQIVTILDTLSKKDSTEIIIVNNEIKDTLIYLQKDTIQKILIVKIDTVEKINTKQEIFVETDDIIKKKEKSGRRFKLGLAFSSHYNYADYAISDKINFGGGLISEIRLNDNFSINSGILYAQNNITSAGNKSGLYANTDTEASLSYENTQETSSDVTLIGLDIPLNIQYNRKKFFVSAGVSSLLYFNEKFKSNYTVENTTEVYNYDTGIYEQRTAYEEVSQTETVEAFQTFDFAKLLNFSVGYKIPVKKGGFIIEPYLKYPLGKLTSKNISLGSGGVSLKYNF